MAGREDDGADRLPERSRRVLAGLTDARERILSTAPGEVGPEALREAITPSRMGEPA